MKLFKRKTPSMVVKGRVFKLLLDANYEGVNVSSYELGGFDYGGLWRGDVGIDLPEGLRLELDLSRPYTDVVGNPLSLWLVTARVIDVVNTLCTDEEVEVHELPVFDGRTGEVVRGYYLMNPLLIVECLDMERSVLVRNRGGQIASVGEPVLRGATTHHIFRAAECPWTIFVSAELKRRWSSVGVVGFYYQDCGVLSGS